jgi:hypothetical protein
MNQERRLVEVKFPSGTEMLSGLLELPSAPGRYPALVFVHGHVAVEGAVNTWAKETYRMRDYYLPTWQRFVALGFACFAWDPPGLGRSTGEYHFHPSYYARAGEVLAAVRFLRARREIDLHRIGLIGVSQAGWVMPLAAHPRGDIAFLIALSCSGGTTWQHNLTMHRRRLERQDMPPEQVEQWIAAYQARIRLVEQKASFDEYRAEMGKFPLGPELETSGHYYQLLEAQSNTIDARQLLRNIDLPLLAVWGEEDTVEDVQVAQEAYADALAAAHNPDFTLTILPGVGHTLDLDNPQAPVYQVIEDWLLVRFK